MPCIILDLAVKKSSGDREPDAHKRQAFQQRLKTKSAGEIVYVDQPGIDHRDEYPCGYCKIGQCFYALKSGKRVEQVSWIAALKAGEGVCTHDQYLLL